jgi:4-amino-4-deoxy-L-arabinose transferase-like glycosyltransferase
LFVAVLILALILLEKGRALGPGADSWRWLAAAGLTLGLVALVRPAGLYFFVFAALALAWSWRRRSGRAAALAILIGASLLIPSAWVLRNKAATGRVLFSSLQGLNIAEMRASSVERELGGGTIEEASTRVSMLLLRELPIDMSFEARAQVAGRWASRLILSHPNAMAQVMIKDAFKLLGGHGLEVFAWLVLHDDRFQGAQAHPSGGFSGTRGLLAASPDLWPLLILYLSFLGATYLAAALGLRGAWGSERETLALPLATIAYFLAITLGVGAYYRYRLPLMPAVFLLAGRALSKKR